ncbi:hypothetical protein NP233_g5463 [Leucocoprinus birnbaumii]|uniref:Putative lipoate-protein ligase A n=1 Tax=Leucocoprinus birnbaumii TaxID=56174 RepID=A0AAD5YUK9_9AGAR|nr:hypothetical protein NP233_g5463 [Leucocoprinus birnbaumii]
MTFFHTFRLPLRRRPLHTFGHRHSSSSTNPQHPIYVSRSTNPYFNLTYEDWLFRHKDVKEPLLLIYRDDPCVVIGRNQNPWKEVNFDALRARPGVPFIRRRSGGGTVYHETMITRGVPSIRSPVCNIQQSNLNVDHDSFTAAVVDEFRKEYGINEDVVEVEESDDLLSIDYIKKGMSELPTWEWAYGQTPEFTYTVDNTFSWGKIMAKLHSKHGLILSCTLNVTESHLSAEDAEHVFQLAKALEGQRYGFIDDPRMPATNKAALSVSSWLKTVMS